MIDGVSSSVLLVTQELTRERQLSRNSADQRAAGTQDAVRRRAQQQQTSQPQTFDAVTFRVDGQATRVADPRNGIDQNTRLPRGSLIDIVT